MKHTNLYAYCDINQLNSDCFRLLSRSPPRPSPGSLHYSDEDVSTKYNDLIPAESSSLTEKPSEISDSQVQYQQLFFTISPIRAPCINDSVSVLHNVCFCYMFVCTLIIFLNSSGIQFCIVGCTAFCVSSFAVHTVSFT